MYALKSIPEQSDEELIKAILAGSSPAFETLIGRHQDRIFRLLSRFTRDWGEVEDLGQEVFVKVFSKLHTFNQDSAFYTWVYRIAVNTAKDHCSRRSHRRLVLVDDAALLDSGQCDTDYAGSAEPLLQAELSEVTRQVLDTLPDKYRQILILREYEELSYTEMSEVLECSMGTVESRLFRARHRFKEALERMHPELVPQVRGGRS